MCGKSVLIFTIVVLIAICAATPVPQNQPQKYNQQNHQNYGKYTVNDHSHNSDGKYYSFDDGKYHPKSHNEGESGGYYDAAGHYVHVAQPYRHVHDNRELGYYVHIPYPYDGGYGPYSGSNIPYLHDARPYIHDVKPYDHNLYTSTTTKKPTTTTKRTTTTTTTTTTTPRNILFNYDDEGRHKILHQEEIRIKDKYDHAFLTENGIYGEEQAKLHKEGGTHAKGYYEYTGDDGQLYRVNYESNDKGFIPIGEHIPTAPPIPEAIARALKWVDDRRKANGEMPMFDERGFRIDQMPKDIMEKLKATNVENMPKDLGDKIKELKHEMEAMEHKGSKMAKLRELKQKHKSSKKHEDLIRDNYETTTINY